MEKKAKYGMVIPRSGRYGICGWDVIVNGLDVIFFSTKAKALSWMKGHGYDVIPC